MIPALRGRENAASPGLLDGPPPRRHEHVAALPEVPHREQRADALAFRERQEIDDRGAARRRARPRDLVDLEPVGETSVREAEQRVVGVGDEQAIDEILLLGPGRDPPAPPAPLRPVLAERTSLDVAGVGQGHGHVLRGDEILPVEASERGFDDRPARIGREPVADVHELAPDHREQPIGILQDLDETCDAPDEVLVFVDDLSLLEPGQAVEPHVENRLGLGRGEAVAIAAVVPCLDPEALLLLGPGEVGAVLEQGDGHPRLPEPFRQPFTRLGRARRAADELDHLFDVRKGHREALQNVRPRPRPFQIEDRAAGSPPRAGGGRSPG